MKIRRNLRRFGQRWSATGNPKRRYKSELVDQLAGLLWRLRRVPAIEAAIVKAREEEAVFAPCTRKLKAKRGTELTMKHASVATSHSGRVQVQVALNTGTYAETLEPFRSQVIEEEEKKGDLDASISKEADERYQERRESELLLLIRDDDGMIEKLSRYQASLMNAANRVVQQLRLIKIMRSSRTLITLE